MQLRAKLRITAVVSLSIAVMVGGFGMLTHQALAADGKKEGSKEPTSTITVKDFVVDTVDMERLTINISKKKEENNFMIGGNIIMNINGQNVPMQIQGAQGNGKKERPVKMEYLRVARDARIVVKGKPAKLSDLRVGMNISVKLGLGKEQIVVKGKDIDLERETILVREIQAQ